MIIKPNPSTGIFTIDLTQKYNENVKLIIQDAFGKMIQTVMVPKYNKEITLSLEEQPAGIYFVSLFKDSEKIQSKRIALLK